MARPRIYDEIYEGTAEELERYLQQQRPDERFRLIRVFTAKPEDSNFPETVTHTPPHDPDLVPQVRSVRGKYAHLGLSTEDFHQERQKDKEQEEQQIASDRP